MTITPTDPLDAMADDMGLPNIDGDALITDPDDEYRHDQDPVQLAIEEHEIHREDDDEMEEHRIWGMIR